MRTDGVSPAADSSAASRNGKDRRQGAGRRKERSSCVLFRASPPVIGVNA
ncbi:hypothetical protein SAMCFNEI73_pC2025 (plasmid) [Sinorhizobium americanum]|uniref:Uncharacterized protein n=1 Tax=Sinorhizobium americanum TaxID=194963 RepID=A0A1L3M0B5_9HYPH|nr:hypothetical protein SAMCFNEI73_pC2025 [Sinorhizobium americanum]